MCCPLYVMLKFVDSWPGDQDHFYSNYLNGTNAIAPFCLPSPSPDSYAISQVLQVRD